MSSKSKSSNTKQFIIETARKIVQKDGLSALSARKLSKETGHSLGSMYSYFKNLDDLILNINAITMDDLYASFLNIKEKDSENIVLSLSKEYFHFADKNENLWQALMEHRFANKQENPAWYQEKVDILFGYIEKQVENTLPNKNASQITILLWASLHGLWMLKTTNKFSIITDENPEDLLENMVANIIG